MKLKDMFKKTSKRSYYISLKTDRPEVPEGLLRKCNKCGAAIIAETDIIFVRSATDISAYTLTDGLKCWLTKALLKSGIGR